MSGIIITDMNDISFQPEQFRIAAEFSPVHMIFTDPEGVIVYANPAAESITGYSREEMIGKPLSRWGGEMPKEFYDRMWQKIKIEKKPFHGELAQTRMNGDLYFAEIWITPVIIDDDLSGFVGVEMDVSDRKKLLENIEESDRSLKLFRQLVDQSSDAIEVLDAESLRYLDMNENGCLDLGYSREELLALDRYAIDPTMSKPLMDDLRKRLADKKPLIFETMHRRKDGTIFPVEVNMRLVALDRQYLVASARDISERRIAEGRFKELDSLKNKFIAIVSHQLRTPLNAVRWNLESLLSGEVGKLKPENEALIRVTYEATSEVIRRIGDLLSAIDIEEGKVILEKEEIDMQSLVAGVLGEAIKRCEMRSITCTFVGSEVSLPALTVDATKFRKALVKIMENAVQYTKPGGVVTLAFKLIDGAVRIEVVDSGIGIPKSEQKRVFTRFFRASNASAMHPDASGLGLYIAKTYIDAHDAKIGFESKEGKGSTFWIELPVK